MYVVFKYVHAVNNNIIWSILSSKYAIEEAESRHVPSDVNDDDAHDNDDDAASSSSADRMNHSSQWLRKRRCNSFCN